MLWVAVMYGSVMGVVLAVSLMKPSTLLTPAVVPEATDLNRFTAGPMLVDQPSHAEWAMST